MKLTEAEFHAHCEAYDGYCPDCDGITRTGDTEPDAEGYRCEDCHEDTAMGIEQALLLGHIEITEEHEPAKATDERRPPS